VTKERLYLRDEASLSPKLQELVMISVAREMSCAFVWYAHPPRRGRPACATTCLGAARPPRHPAVARLAAANGS
jgi:hypothetical protein